ncbi:MAG: S1 RNA-binding domain-containing protein [Clostridia bacterium]|nr:S1 RNA-binding domain-containing protein [Clostridia bacterium]
MAFKVGDSVKGTVNGVTSFGAFVKLESGETGLIHISKLARGFVRDVQSVVNLGDPVTATVISVEGGKIGLSLIGEPGKRAANRASPGDFESMLSSFKSASSERLSALGSQGGEPRPRRRK